MGNFSKDNDIIDKVLWLFIRCVLGAKATASNQAVLDERERKPFSVFYLNEISFLTFVIVARKKPYSAEFTDHEKYVASLS